MNSIELTAEIRQILEADIQLRKEFDALRRSMNQYRNQLIASEELCKRQEVSIEVLKTKLENQGKELAAYKSEVEAFKELRETFRHQLEAKQKEIEKLISRCASLEEKIKETEAYYQSEKKKQEEELNVKISEIIREKESEIIRITSEMEEQKKQAEREFLDRIRYFEDLIGKLSQEKDRQWTDKINEIQLLHRLEINRQKEEWNQQILKKEEEINSRMAEEMDAYRKELEEKNNRIGFLQNQLEKHQQEICTLNQQLSDNESQWTEKLKTQEEKLRLAWEEFKHWHEEKVKELEAIHNSEKECIRNQYEEQMQKTIQEYENKLSNLIYQTQLQKEHFSGEATRHQQALEDIQKELEEKNARIISLEQKIEEFRSESEILRKENNELRQLHSGTLFQIQERVDKVREEYQAEILEKDEKITSLLEGQENMASLLESFMNELNQKESHIAELNQTILQRDRELNELRNSLSEFASSVEKEKQTLLTEKNEIISQWEEKLSLTEEKFKNILASKEDDFRKLIAENELLIKETQEWEDKYTRLKSESELLVSEMEEIRSRTDSRIMEWKEILETRNFEITNLKANIAGLEEKVKLLMEENNKLLHSGVKYTEAENELKNVRFEKEQLEEWNKSLKKELENILTTSASYEQEIQNLRNALKEKEELLSRNQTEKIRSEEDERFIRKLFRNIDELNAEKLKLLEEKEKMTDQLIKMNEILENLSQNIDNQQVDTRVLNDHRKNVILASQNKSSREDLKEKINELLYEIDKCIQLLG